MGCKARRVLHDGRTAQRLPRAPRRNPQNARMPTLPRPTVRLLRPLATLALLCAALLPLPGCGTAPPGNGPALLLLGEVHDNAAQHALRLQRAQALLDGGARPALLMEQFDRERQADINRLLQAVPAMDSGGAERDGPVDALVQLGRQDSAGWDWPLYRPYLHLALQYRLPIVAANVSRTDARLVMQQGLAARGFDATVPADIQAAQAGAIQQSHCGQVDAVLAGRMALAQVARDQFMARSISAHAGRGVLLLAGNGHVRKDVGVPRWLPPGLQARSLAVGYLEAGDASAAAFDAVVFTAAQPRNNPCAGMPAVATDGSSAASPSSPPATTSRARP